MNEMRKLMLERLYDLVSLTMLYRYVRPEEKDKFVYAVDGELEYNIVLFASEIDEDGKLVGEPSELIIAREWVKQNAEKIVSAPWVRESFIENS